MKALVTATLAATARRVLRQALALPLAALAACGTTAPTSGATGAAGTAPASTAAATTDTAPGMTAVPTTTTVGAGTVTSDRPMSGILYYQARQGGTTYVYSLRGTAVIRHLAIPSDVCASNSVSVSPDGKRVAWVSGDTQHGGMLTVADLDGSHPRTLSQRIHCLGNFPAWADSTHIKVSLAPSGTTGLLDLASGGFTAQSPEQFRLNVTRSANGAYQTYRDGDRIVIRTAEGALVRQVRHGAVTEEGGFTVTGVSDDGRYAAVGPEATDPSRIIAGWSVFDTVTGRDVPLAVKATRGHAEVYLGADGAMVLRIHETGQPVRLCQVSGSGKAACRQEPAQLGMSLRVIGYRA